MLTVIIPSYNHAEYVLETLSAALTIDVPGLKILVVDDGSKDASVELVKAYINEVEAQDKVALIEKTNGGLVSSLNLALGIIDTEFCWVVASDDILVPDGVKGLVDAISAHPEMAFIMGGGHYFDKQGRGLSIYKSQHADFFALTPERRDEAIFLSYPSPLLLQSSVFRTRALKGIGGWDPALKLDDYPTFVKLLQHHRLRGIHFDFMPKVDCVGYRQHGVNTYKNVYGQFFMVRQAMQALAPVPLQSKAIARTFAFYTLVALKNRKLDFFGQVFRSCSVGEWLRGVAAIPAVALRYARIKLK